VRQGLRFSREQVPHQHVATYLNDHLAGSVAAVELLQHLEKAHSGTATGRFVSELRTDITADQHELKSLMGRLGVTSSPPRKAAAWFAEKLTEFKLRLDDQEEGAFRLFESLEFVSIGIEGKRLLWRALAALAKESATFQGPDYANLEKRAEQQRQRVDSERLKAAKAALGAAS
jgi:hypothetical protein